MIKTSLSIFFKKKMKKKIASDYEYEHNLCFLIQKNEHSLFGFVFIFYEAENVQTHRFA